MSPKDAYMKLIKCVNIEFYVGPQVKKVIEDHCMKTPAGIPKKPQPVAKPKVEVKKSLNLLKKDSD